MRRRACRLLTVLHAAASGLLLSACPDDCEVACGKLEYCVLLGEQSRRACIDQCEASPEGAASPCADCLDNTRCGAIGGGQCRTACEGVVEAEDWRRAPPGSDQK